MRAPSGTAVALSMLAAILAVAGLLASCRWPAGGAGPSRPGTGTLNKRCFECHIDFEGEELTLLHQKAGVGCVRCHGESQAHMADEVRATPADATFRGKSTRIFCLTCHDPVAHLKYPAHTPEAAKRRSCTDCHGDHKLLPANATTPPPAP